MYYDAKQKKKRKEQEKRKKKMEHRTSSIKFIDLDLWSKDK